MRELSPADLAVLIRTVERVLFLYGPPLLAPGYIREGLEGGVIVASGAIIDGCGWPLRHVAEIDADGRILWEGCG